MSAGDPSISVRSTHQLESRMREIRLSGSGEGAVLSRPYLIKFVLYTCTESTFQMARAYSRIARSLENFPIRAALRIAIFAQRDF